ncbi:MAG TPA: septation protein SpoVG family protein [Vicinamibacteria bacterium]
MKVDFYTPKGRDTKILAFADVTLSEGVVVRGFRVADGSNGVFAAVPSKPITVNGEKRFWNQVAFTSNEIRERFLGELLEDYHRWRKNEAGHPPPEAKALGAEDAEEGPPF